MNATEKNLATARGEALGAKLIAMCALQTTFMFVPPEHRERIIGQMNKFIDESLNMARPAKGDPHDELNTLMREIARNVSTDALDHLTSIVKSVPKNG